MMLVPTLLEVVGLKMPEFNHGVKQYPMSGVSMAYTFEAKPDAPTRKKVQYYEMFGTRGIWKEGWHAAAVHAPINGTGHFDEDEWELYNMANDRSELHDCSREHPDMVADLSALWDRWASRVGVEPWERIKALRREHKTRNG